MRQPLTDVAQLPDLRCHVVIINVNRKLPAIVRDVQAGLGADGGGRDIVVFVQDEALWREHPEWHPDPRPPHRVHIMQGCPGNPEDLRAASIDQCDTALILADPTQGDLGDAKCALIALAIEHQNPDIHTIIELVHTRHRTHLFATEVNEMVCMGKLTEELLAQSTISPGILPIVNELLEVSPDTPSFATVPVPEALVGVTYRNAVETSIDGAYPYIICGFVRSVTTEDGRREKRRYVNPGRQERETVLRDGDALVVIGW